jgi:tetratricopeptide (TPR) repeat protein
MQFLPPRSRGPAASLPLVAALLLVLSACQASYQERLEQAKSLQESGQLWDSIEPLRKLLEEKPGDAEASYLLGTALAGTGQPSLAVIPLLRASDDPAYAVTAGLMLASTQLGLQNYEEAERAATKVLDTEADNKRALLIRYEARLGSGHLDAALEDADAVLAKEPGGYEGLMAKATVLLQQKKLDESEAVYRQLADAYAKEDSERGVRSCLGLGGLYGERKDKDKAVAQIESCLESHPGPLSVQLSSQLLAWVGRTDRAIEVLRQGIERNPQQGELRTNLAKTLIAAGKRDEAEQVLLDTANTFSNPPAWIALADFRRKIGKLAEARDALQHALDLSPEQSQDLRFQLADLLIDLKELDEAERIAGELKEPAYRDHLDGRILVERGEYEKAIPVLERSLSQWPNNAGARYAAAKANFELGRYDRARAQLLEAHRLDARGNDAALLIARLHLIEGNLDQAIFFAKRHLEFRGNTGPEPYLIAARAAWAKGRPKEAAEFLQTLRKIPPYEGVAVAELARLEGSSGNPKAAITHVEETKLDLTAPENLELLRTYMRLLIETGQGEKALATAKRAAAAQGDSAKAKALLGSVQLEIGDEQGAKAAFEAALATDPASGAALGGLGRLAVVEGHTQDALDYFDRAEAADPEQPTWPFEAARVRAAQGDKEAAAEALGDVLRRFPDFAPAANDLAWSLAEQNADLDRALQLALRAARTSPEPEVLDTLGYVRLQRGELDEAAEAFRSALRRRPEFATGQYHLGLTLSRMGDVEGAGAALRAALQKGAFPEADEARAELARLGTPGGAEVQP